jgi:HD superfamily phosphohydrolase
MNPVVYSHHVARIAKAMLRRASERLLDATAVGAEQLRRMDDAELLVALRDSEATAEYGRRLAYRDLFKRGVWAEMDAVPEDLIGVGHDRRRELERDIAESAGVDRESVVLDAPAEPEMTETSSRVMVGGEIRSLAEQSTLVRALRAAQRDQWRLGVYAPPERKEAVGEAAVSVLGIDVEDARVQDIRPGVHATLDEFQ